MTNREIEIYLERLNERMVRAYGRELQPLEREAVRRDLVKAFRKRSPLADDATAPRKKGGRQ